MVLASPQTGADVESVVQRDLVTVRHQLVQRAVVEGGGEVAQETGQALAGVEDVTICTKNKDEPVNGLQHEMSELFSGEKLWLPVSLDFIRLKNKIVVDYEILENVFHCVLLPETSETFHCVVSRMRLWSSAPWSCPSSCCSGSPWSPAQ